MPPKTTRRELVPVPPELLPFQVGEKIAFPDIIDSPGALSDAQRLDTVEARHPKHKFAGMYGRVEAIGVCDGELQFDVTVIDPVSGQPVSEAFERVTMKEIQ